ncbi:MAG: zinc ribbon domain-containing protein [Clostridiaceae bacterium]|nr:zinc ribbon domain-containing protein [Clostridiaceae bacterium]
MLTRYEVSKTYSYFHLFFISTFRWNVKYLVTTGCCGNLFELAPEIGRSFEKKQITEIRNEHLKPISQYVPYKYCSACHAKVDSGYSFCPYCGQKL